MKKQFIYIWMGMLMLVGASCAKDFLTIDPVDSRVLDNYYKTELEIRASTAPLYSARPWFDYLGGLMWYTDLAAGDMYHTWDQEGQFFYFSFNNGNRHLTSGWQALYRTNSYCNAVINDMPPIAAKNGVNQVIIEKGVAEARFIRAWVNFILTEYWGDIPIIENGSAMISSGNMMVPKNKQKSVYEFIRRDLEYAVEKLPGKETQAGRATKWAAKGLLAKLYLTMASHLADANSAANFNQAKLLAKEVIENTDGYALHQNYGYIFTIAGNNSPESLFAIQMIGSGGYGVGNNRPAHFSRSSIIGEQAWGGGKGPTLNFQNSVEAGDKRRREIYMRLGDFYPELNKQEGGYTYKIRNLDADGKDLEGPNDILANLKKYVIGKSADVDGLTGTNQDGGNNLYFMRMAEMYLIYAEAAIGAGSETSDPLAIQYINAVRTRAGLINRTAPLTFNQVMQERRVEFAMEGIRWYDIKRMFYRNPASAAQYLNAMQRENRYQTKSGATDEERNSYAGYEIFVPTTPITIYESQIAKFPIPAEALLINPLLEGEAVDYNFN
jgi:starch-binding outer membrane protein, SusD/RagB family